MNIILFLGGVIGFLSVAMGAYIDHILKVILDPKMVNALATAVRYHQFYAGLITIIGLLLFVPLPNKVASKLFWAGLVFVLAITLFSFSIYLSALLQITWVIKCVPVGGSLFMLGWLILVWTAFIKK